MVLLIALTVIVGMMVPLNAQDCSASSLRQCLKAFNSLKDFRTYLVLDDVLPSWNRTEIQHLCVWVNSTYIP